MNFIFYLAGCFFFIILQSLFSGSEIAFISSSRLRLQHLIIRGDKKAKAAFELISNPEKFLATTLVGANISVVISASLATLFLIKLRLNNSNMWITFLFTPLVVIFAELVPKEIGRFYREKFSCAVSPLIKFFELVFYPVVLLTEGVSRYLVKLFIGKKRKRSPFVTREEIKSLLKGGESSGVLDRGQREAIEDIFDFKDTKVKDVLISLKRVIGLDYTDSRQDILEKARQYGFTRYPVFRAKGGSAFGPKSKEIIGYVNIYDLFYKSADNWTNLIRSIMRVEESQKLYEVFTNSRIMRENIILVMRGKKALGIVTIEDIIREIITSIVKY